MTSRYFGIIGMVFLFTVRITIYLFVAQCSTDISIDNGNVKFGEDSMSVTYQCSDGYELVGSATATCNKDGTWSSSPPKCFGMIDIRTIYCYIS